MNDATIVILFITLGIMATFMVFTYDLVKEESMADILNEDLEEGARRISQGMQQAAEEGTGITRTDDKIRDKFTVWDDNKLYARGTMYEQGNIQLSYRAGIGDCAEQYDHIGTFMATHRENISIIDFTGTMEFSKYVTREGKTLATATIFFDEEYSE